MELRLEAEVESTQMCNFCIADFGMFPGLTR